MSDLLSCLLQCETRASLLRLLLWEKRTGSVSELARRAELSPRAVGKEVEHLVQLGLARVTTVGAARMVSADWENAACPLLVQLMQIEAQRASEPLDPIRESLAAFGAPLLGVEREAHFTLEATIVKALAAARGDGTLLRVLPVVVAKHRNHLDWLELAELARGRGLKAELGWLLEQTGHLLSDEGMKSRSQAFKDRRRTSMRYFPEPRSRYEKKQAEAASPAIARDWGFFMNMSEDSLRSLLAKHCPEMIVA